MNDEKVATEVAESEFDRFIEAMDIDVDPAGMDDEDKKSYESARRLIVGAIRAGRVTVDAQGQPIFAPNEGQPITFFEATGASLMAMDQKKKNHDVTKMFAAMADITKQPITRYAKMAKRDLKICLAFAALFLS